MTDNEPRWEYEVVKRSIYRWQVRLYRNGERVGSKNTDLKFLAKFHARQLRREWKAQNTVIRKELK